MQVCEVQRSRILIAAMQVVGEVGYVGMSVARVTGRGGVSRRTFYEIFGDREDCFLALFEDALARAGSVTASAFAASPGGWWEKARAGLGASLGFFDDEPGLGRLLVVDALGAGPLVLDRRARVLEQLARTIEDGAGGASRRTSTRRGEPSSLTAEGVVGGVLAVLHARMLEDDPGSLMGLLNQLMGMIVLPYQGQAAAAKELTRPIPRHHHRVPTRVQSALVKVGPHDPLNGLPMRLTYRTMSVLGAIATAPGSSNRQIADTAGVHDQGQISKLLARLKRLGLVHNDSNNGQPNGEPNIWTLTPKGHEIHTALNTGAAQS